MFAVFMSPLHMHALCCAGWCKALLHLQGIWRQTGQKNMWNWYWIEVIDYRTQSAARILVTPTPYEELESYCFDPFKRGGPVYCEGANYEQKYWALRRTARFSGQGTFELTVEFLRESSYE